MFKKSLTLLFLIPLITLNTPAKFFEMPTDDIISRLIFDTNFQPAVIKTWDGGGATNNWTDAANWSDDTVPTANDRAVFDGTSVKNATINQSISIDGIDILSGYTGTISQGASNLTLTNTSVAFTQADGVFAGGSGTIDIEGRFNLSGGTFTASSGSTFFGNQFSLSTGVIFNHNNGTVVWDGVSSDNFIRSPLTLNNFIINKNDGAFFTLFDNNNVVVLGALTLTDGSFRDGSPVIEARGSVVFGPNFDGNGGSSGGTVLITAGDGQPRTVNLEAGFKLTRITLNAPNVTINTSGTGTLEWQILNLQAGTINQSANVNFVFNNPGANTNYQQSGGTINGSAGSMFFTGNHPNFKQTGGAFNGSSGDITFAGVYELTGGTFTASSNTTSFGLSSTPFGSTSITFGAGATFNHNNGTVIWNGGSATYGLAATLTLNNFVVSKNDGANCNISPGESVVVVLGSLTLTDGNIASGIVQARGAVNINQNFDGGGGFLSFANGSAARTITLLGGTNLPHIDLSDPLVTIQTAGTGTLNWRSLFLRQGTINQGNLPFNFDQVNTTYGINVSGGTFNASDQLININNSGLQVSGGAFNGSSGNIVIDNTDTNASRVQLSGGTFTASSGTLFINGSYENQGGIFNHNNGTVIFDGPGQPAITGNDTFFNLTINGNYFFFGTATTQGNALLNTGSFTNLFGGDNGTINARGNLTISSAFNGGTGSIMFSGAANQTYTNNGGQNPNGNWRLDKSGGKVTLTSDLDISSVNFGSGAQLFLTNGTITTGAFKIKNGLRPITRTNGYINGKLQRDFDTVGSRSFPVGTTNGFSPVTVNVTNLAANPSGLTIGSTQTAHPQLDPAVSLERFWTITETGDLTADLTFTYLQTDVHGSEANYRVNRIAGNVEILTTTLDTNANTGTVSGISDFNADWTLSGTTPPLQISPSSATVNSGNQITFTATGGIAPYTFSIFTNNSGGSINSSTGVYTAGSTFGVTDTVRVTDANGGRADAAVSVLAPFTVVNTNDSGGGSLRQALQNANSRAGVQTVTFDIPGNAPHTIQIVNPLTVTDGTNIDGSTQSGYTGTPVIEIDGGNIAPGADGIRLFGGGSTIKSLAINRVRASSNSGGAAIAAITGGNYTIQNCYLGTDTTGTISLGNDKGISIGNSLIGGSRQLNQANIISSNRIGIEAGDGNTIQGNYIGTNPNGNNLGNGTGILIQGGINNLIGDGADSNKANTIAYSNGTDSVSFAGDGIHILSFTGANGTSNRIVGNSIYQNIGEGIDLFPNGVTPNDVCDADTGANDLQNFPVITSAVTSGSNIRIQGTLNSRPNQNYRIDFYLNQSGDASGNGEGEFYIGSTNVSTALDCNASFDVNLSSDSVLTLNSLTATATDDSGNTSEFSAFRAIGVVSPLIVTNTNDSGEGSLRNAIIAANSMPGAQTISFNIAGNAPFAIFPSSPLPEIMETTTIDGTSQPGYAGTPLIEIVNNSFQNNVSGLVLQGSGSVVKGLALIRFNFGLESAGIVAAGSGGHIVKSNYLGTGVNFFGTNNAGIIILSSNNIIGGSTANERNMISFNTVGVDIRENATGNIVQGNFIGTNPTGASAFPNNYGVFLGGMNNSIIGNVISGNRFSGVTVGGNFPNNDTVQNNITGNIIGFDANGANPLANLENGIWVFGPMAHGTRISQNRISGNGNLGIKLSNNAWANPILPLINDPQDADTGANDLQNYPVLNNVSTINGETQVLGSFNSTPSSTFTLEFFSSQTCDFVHSRGETFITSTTVTTDAGGIAGFSPLILPVVIPDGRFITVTATDSQGNTSEFSPCVMVNRGFIIFGRVTKTDGQPLANAQLRLTGNGNTISRLTNSEGFYSFVSVQNGNYTLTVSHPDYTFTPASREYQNLSADQFGQDFTGAQTTFSITGQARTTSTASTVQAKTLMPPVPAGAFPLLGVNFHITGNGVDQTITNDRFGNYRFGGLAPGNYTVTPSKPNYTFTPPSATVTVKNGEVPLNFVGESLGLSTLSGRIIYDSRGNIEAMNADGSGVVTFAGGGRNLSVSSPRYSADGSRFVYLTYASSSGLSRIVNATADGINKNGVFSISDQLTDPVFSPDNSRIAYSDSTHRLFIMNADGSNNSFITGSCRDADWSPDNSKIVCINDGDSIVLIDLAQRNTSIIDNSSELKFSPRFSPDGTRIAFIRRQGNFSVTHSLVVKTLNGNIPPTIIPDTSNLYQTLAWSPDSERLLFVRTQNNHSQLVTTQADGQNLLVINDNFYGNNLSWSRSNSLPTPASPTPTTIQSGAISLTFPATSGANAFTTITPIEPNSVGTAPSGFVIGNFAFEISTTANFTPPVTICVNLGAINNLFLPPGNIPHIFHLENGTLVHLNSSYDPATNTVCAQTNSFSPFVITEQIDQNLPSITGLVVDSNGNPLSNVAMNLTGAENRLTTTDSDGIFRFVNLTNGANYNVQPHKVGFLFTEYSQDFINSTGEQTVVFTGAAQNFQVGGRVTDGNGNGVSGIGINLSGAESAEILTDVDGNYTFANLPADGNYIIKPSNGGNSFAPAQIFTGVLTGDLSGADFVQLAPTAANVSIGGRVLNAQGNAISNARLVLTDTHGRRMTARTNPFGYYVFEDLTAGEIYIITVSHKRYVFADPTRVVNTNESVTNLDFTGQE